MQEQCIAVDARLQMELDVVTEGEVGGDIAGAHCNLVAARTLRLQGGLIRATEQIRGVVASRPARRHPDADGGSDHLVADLQGTAQSRLEPVRE